MKYRYTIEKTPMSEFEKTAEIDLTGIDKIIIGQFKEWEVLNDVFMFGYSQALNKDILKLSIDNMFDRTQIYPWMKDIQATVLMGQTNSCEIVYQNGIYKGIAGVSSVSNNHESIYPDSVNFGDSINSRNEEVFWITGSGSVNSANKYVIRNSDLFQVVYKSQQTVSLNRKWNEEYPFVTLNFAKNTDDLIDENNIVQFTLRKYYRN